MGKMPFLYLQQQGSDSTERARRDMSQHRSISSGTFEFLLLFPRLSALYNYN
jgi:hypothetical protein